MKSSVPETADGYVDSQCVCDNAKRNGNGVKSGSWFLFPFSRPNFFLQKSPLLTYPPVVTFAFCVTGLYRLHLSKTFEKKLAVWFKTFQRRSVKIRFLLTAGLTGMLATVGLSATGNGAELDGVREKNPYAADGCSGKRNTAYGEKMAAVLQAPMPKKASVMRGRVPLSSGVRFATIACLSGWSWDISREK